MTKARVELIRRIEEAAAAAWPAAVVREIDGWQFRLSGGVTRRANSVLAVRSGESVALAEKIRQAEQFYVEHNAPPCWHISPAVQPENLDEVLAERGYRIETPTFVQTATSVDVMDRVYPRSFPQVVILPHLTDSWFTAYCEAEGYGEATASARREILHRIRQPAGYAAAFMAGRIGAVGLGVMADEWAGVFCMVTRPEVRRQGAASALLRGLAEWAHRQGGRQLYLQVMKDNTPALALYACAGFEPLYSYHYREKHLGS
jgi:GNAT superfamily N-acetyltransferase